MPFRGLYIKESSTEFITASGISGYTIRSNYIPIKFWFKSPKTTYV